MSTQSLQARLGKLPSVLLITAIAISCLAAYFWVVTVRPAWEVKYGKGEYVMDVPLPGRSLALRPEIRYPGDDTPVYIVDLEKKSVREESKSFLTFGHREVPLFHNGTVLSMGATLAKAKVIGRVPGTVVSAAYQGIYGRLLMVMADGTAVQRSLARTDSIKPLEGKDFRLCQPLGNIGFLITTRDGRIGIVTKSEPQIKWLGTLKLRADLDRVTGGPGRLLLAYGTAGVTAIDIDADTVAWSVKDVDQGIADLAVYRDVIYAMSNGDGLVRIGKDGRIIGETRLSAGLGIRYLAINKQFVVQEKMGYMASNAYLSFYDRTQFVAR